MKKYCRRTISFFFGVILLSSSTGLTHHISAISGVTVSFVSITNNGGGSFTVNSDISATLEPGETLTGIHSTVNDLTANAITPTGVTFPTSTNFANASASDTVSGNLGDLYCVVANIDTPGGSIETSTCTELNEFSDGTVSVANTNCSINWQATNAEVISASMNLLTSTLTVNINAVESGGVHLPIPRALLDSVLGGFDHEFLAQVDGAESFYTELETTLTHRTLQIPTELGNETIEIIGNVSGTCGQEGQIIITGPGQESPRRQPRDDREPGDYRFGPGGRLAPWDPLSSTSHFDLPRTASGAGSRIPDDPIITSQDYWVNLHSGELVGGGNVISLMSSRGSLPLRFDLTYRSQAIYDGPVGQDWQHSYDKRLIFLAGGDVAVQNGYLRSDIYTFDSFSGKYISPAGFYTELEEQIDGTFTLTDKYRTVETYNSTGRLTSIIDRNLNSLLFEYDLDGNLTLITDAHDRNITLTYDASNRISQITDFASRVTTFGYTLGGRLDFVTTPATTDFPAGKTVTFGYNADEKLSSITDPRGQNYMEFFYQNITNRVIEHRVGLGSYLYSYDDLNNVTTEIDRNGNQVDWTFNGPLSTTRQVFTNRNIDPSDPEVYTTLYSHNSNHEITQVTFPNGNQDQFTFDELNADPLQRGNLLQMRQIALPVSPENDIVYNFTYEPLFNQIKTIAEARGNDPSFVPQNGGANSAGRYTSTFDYDYEEATLGDLNGDGMTTQDHGNVVRITQPIANPFGVPHPEFSPQFGSQNIVGLFRYNEFGQVLESVDPEGNTNKYEYFATNGTPGDPFDTEGFLQRSTLDFGLGTDPNTGQPRLNIENEYAYDTRGNLVLFTDGRGLSTTFVVNERDQRTEITSPSPLNYQTNFFYDANDNLSSIESSNIIPDLSSLSSSILSVPNILDPTYPTFTDEYQYDILNNLTLMLRDAKRPTGSPSSTQPEILTWIFERDKNENLVLVRSPEAVDNNQPNNVESFVFDERNLPFTYTRGGVTNQFRSLGAHAHIVTSAILDIPDASTATFNYDGNGNRVELRDGTNDPVFYTFDGFNRMISITDALGNNKEFEYDPESNVVREATYGPIGGQGPGGNGNPNNTGANNVLFNQMSYRYDELGRNYIFERSFFDPSTGLPLADGPLTSGDGEVTGLMEFDKNGRLIKNVNDNVHNELYLYDGVSRLVKRTDHLLNSIEYKYDQNSNEIETTETEQSAGNPQEIFVTRSLYDNLDRPVRTSNPLGETQYLLYDSRDNLVFGSDANGLEIPDSYGIFPGDINDHGNTVRFSYDGINRQILDSSDLRVGGIGAGSVFDTIERSYEYDGNSRNVKQTDNNANPTQYSYDVLNRLIGITNADGTGRAFGYDKDGNVLSMTDENGSAFANSYDPLSRLIQSSISRAPGVVGTTLLQYEYDGSSRLAKGLDNNGENPIPNLNPVTEIDDLISQINGLGLSNKDKNSLLRPLQSAKKILTDNKPSNDSKACAQLVNFINAVNNLVNKGTLTTNQASDLVNQTASIQQNLGCILPPSNDSTIFFKYDSLDNIMEENQNGELVRKTWDGVRNMLDLSYPGGRQISHQYDELERVSSIDEGGTALVSYDYIGQWRVLNREYSNGLTMQMNYDPARRITSLNHVLPDTSVMQGFGYEYDRMGNVISESRAHEGDGDTFSYDSLYRIEEARFDQSNLSDPSTAQSIGQYGIDGVNNWEEIQRTEGGLPLSIHPNSANNMNEYDSFANAENLFDNNGNLIQKTIYDEFNAVESVIRYQYDALNRLIIVSQSVGGGPEEQFAVYQYDALSRRVAKQTFDLPNQTFFYYDVVRNIEEQSGGSTTATYVDNPENVNEHLVMDRTGNARLFYHANIMNSVHGLSDASGNLVEEVRYDVYGRPSFNTDTLDFDTLEVRRIHDPSPNGNPYLYTGGRFDAETGLGYWMFRYYDPEQGRFMQRDPLGIWGDMLNMGNPYSYVSNSPFSGTDPYGLNISGNDSGLHIIWSKKGEPLQVGIEWVYKNGVRGNLFKFGVNEQGLYLGVGNLKKQPPKEIRPGLTIYKGTNHFYFGDKVKIANWVPTKGTWVGREFFSTGVTNVIEAISPELASKLRLPATPTGGGSGSGGAGGTKTPIKPTLPNTPTLGGGRLGGFGFNYAVGTALGDDNWTIIKDLLMARELTPEEIRSSDEFNKIVGNFFSEVLKGISDSFGGTSGYDPYEYGGP